MKYKEVLEIVLSKLTELKHHDSTGDIHDVITDINGKLNRPLLIVTDNLKYYIDILSDVVEYDEVISDCIRMMNDEIKTYHHENSMLNKHELKEHLRRTYMSFIPKHETNSNSISKDDVINVLSSLIYDETQIF